MDFITLAPIYRLFSCPTCCVLEQRRAFIWPKAGAGAFPAAQDVYLGVLAELLGRMFGARLRKFLPQVDQLVPFVSDGDVVQIVG